MSPSGASTILALQTDSAWAVIFVVSLVTLVAVLLSRRLIDCCGGLASGILLSLPLVLPLVAAALFGHPVLPEVAILRPAVDVAMDAKGGDLRHLLLLRDAGGTVVVPYAVAASTGQWLLLFGGLISSVMLLRRVLGAFAMRRLIRRCLPLRDCERAEIEGVIAHLAVSMRLKRAPEVLALPRGVPGAFATTKNRILIARDLLECLDESELEATLAHEMAHLKARDVSVVMVAGFLRDFVAWNPIAHIALRRLTIDRELEADRRAATVTGRPLAVASSLLKMCELMKRRRGARVGVALGMWPGRGQVRRRVTHLLALADATTAVDRGRNLPFVAAAALAAALALQVAAQLTSSSQGAVAFVWGAPTSADADVWSPHDLKRDLHATAVRPNAHKRGVRDLDQPLPPRRAIASLRSAPAVAEKHLGRWMETVDTLARARAGLPPGRGLPTGHGWRFEPVFQDPPIASLGVYRVERLPLAHRPVPPPE